MAAAQLVLPSLKHLMIKYDGDAEAGGWVHRLGCGFGFLVAGQTPCLSPEFWASHPSHRRSCCRISLLLLYCRPCWVVDCTLPRSSATLLSAHQQPAAVHAG